MTAKYTLARGVETTQIALCEQHHADRLDSYEEDGWRITDTFRSDDRCVVCREFDEQTRAEIRANTQ